MQSQFQSQITFTGTTVYENSQNRLVGAESNSCLLTERFADGKTVAQQKQIAPPKYTKQDVPYPNLIQGMRTAKGVLTHFEKSASERAMGKMNLQELMLYAVEQIGVAKFESNSLEIFAQDGYTMDRNGCLSAKTFVYSKNLQYRVSHHATSYRTAFGCLWIRKTTLQSDEETQRVTSYILYPNTWMQWLGVRNGLEAIIACAGRNSLLNCRLSVTRAVAEDSLIFELCRAGQTRAVEILLSKGLGSVADTSPRGWKPLHVSKLHSWNSSEHEPGTCTNRSLSLRRLAVMSTCALC